MRVPITVCSKYGALLLLPLLASERLSAQPPVRENIEPSDVYQLVDRLRGELELLRKFKDLPTEGRPELGISGADPREVFFLALTLFRKADRLCFEQTRERKREEPQPPTEGRILPGDVYRAVDGALQRILRVKKRLKLTDAVAARKRDESKTPSDVLRSIIQANRQLNLLLDRQFSPSDVYQQVTIAVGYAERVLGAFPTSESMPRTPSIQPDKEPSDVYIRLLDSYQRARAISIASNRRALKLERPTDELIQNVAPSDVYDIASLLVSELNFLHRQLGSTPPPRAVYYPGHKTPSDVFQRVGILEQQLIELQNHVSANPDWLDPKP